MSRWYRLKASTIAVTPAALETMRTLAGVTREEFLKASGHWRVPAANLALKVSQRLEFVTERQAGGRPLRMEEIFTLLPELRTRLARLDSALAPDTPWFVGLLSFYADPMDALRNLEEIALGGASPRKGGEETFAIQRNWWVNRRASGLGGFLPGTIKALFYVRRGHRGS